MLLSRHYFCFDSQAIDLAGVAPISTTFNGTATLRTTDSRASGPFSMPISFGVFFFEGHGSVSLTDFPELVTAPFEVDTPFGRRTNVTVVRKTSGGDGLFNKPSGGFAIPVSLFLDHSLDFPFVEEDSSLSIVLQTGAAGGVMGVPLDRATGKLTLVGVGRLVDGILDGATGTVILDGSLATVP